MKKYIVLWLLMAGFGLHAQNYTISGTITDKQNGNGDQAAAIVNEESGAK